MKYAAPVIACALFLGGAAQARDSLGVFERWGAFRDAKIPRCYAISEPVKDNHQSRWRPFAAVGYWPKKSVHGQMHFRLSREKAPKAQVSLSIGARRFTLTAGGADAWAPDKRVDAAIIAAIRSGRSEEHTSELQSLMRNLYAVFCLNKKTKVHQSKHL